MTKTLLFVASAAVALFPVASVAAQAQPAGRGYEATLSAGRVCLRPTVFAEAIRLGIPLRHTECLSPSRWATEGLKVQLPTA